MSRAKKPNPQCGAVQPYNPPELCDGLINNLKSHLNVSDKDMQGVTKKVKHRLGMYRAEVVSLDKKPSMASVKSEIEPIVNMIRKLEQALSSITPASLNIVYEKNIGKRDVVSLLNEAPCLLGELEFSFTPILLDESEARGNLPMEARRLLIISLADIYEENTIRSSLACRDDFILEILEDQCIPEPDKRKLEEILEPVQ